MTRPDILEAIHRALLSQGINDRDTHEYLDWIEDHMDDERRTWWLRAVGMGLLGFLAAVGGCLIVR